MALLPKGGIEIAGHKVPWEAIGAIAALAGVFLVIRARQQGSNVASVGQPPASAIDPSLLGFGSTSPDFSAALANLSQQVGSLQQTGINTPSTPAAPTSWVGTLRGNVNPESGQSFAGTVNIPIFSSPGVSTGGTLGELSNVTITGAPVTGAYGSGSRAYYPIQGPGGTEYVLAQDVTGFQAI